MLAVLLLVTSTAFHRLVAAALRDDGVQTQFDADLQVVNVGRVVHILMAVVQLVLWLCAGLDVLVAYIALGLWTMFVHEETRRADRAVAVLAGAGWWWLAGESLVASSVVYYNLLSLPYYVTDVVVASSADRRHVEKLSAAQAVLSALYWLGMFVGFTQHPLPLDCVVLPLVFHYDVGLLGRWLSRIVGSRSDAKSHAQ